MKLRGFLVGRWGPSPTSRLLCAAAIRLLCAAAIAVAPARALAAPSDVALAETLYETARALMDRGNYAEACPKLVESYRLDPATGTLLNLAACHEAQGKFASAWIEYVDGAAAADRDGRPDRVRYAEEQSRNLVPKLSRLTIMAAPEVDASSLQITLDGAIVGIATLGVPAPLDPGDHLVEAKSVGKKPFVQRVTLGAVADQQTVTIPPLLAEEPKEPLPVAAPVAAAAPVVVQSAPPPSPKLDEPAPIPTSVWIAGGTTLALGIGTAVTGGLYLKHNGSDHDAAQTFGVANAVLFSATVVAAGVTGYLYFTRPDEPRAGFRLSPSVGRGFAGISADGAF